MADRFKENDVVIVTSSKLKNKAIRGKIVAIEGHLNDEAHKYSIAYDDKQTTTRGRVVSIGMHPAIDLRLELSREDVAPELDDTLSEHNKRMGERIKFLIEALFCHDTDGNYVDRVTTKGLFQLQQNLKTMELADIALVYGHCAGMVFSMTMVGSPFPIVSMIRSLMREIFHLVLVEGSYADLDGGALERFSFLIDHEIEEIEDGDA